MMLPARHPNAVWLGCCALLWLVLVGPAVAQDADGKADADDGEAKQPRAAVLVETDRAVIEQFAEIEQRIASDDHDAAVAMLQALIESDSPTLMPVSGETHRLPSSVDAATMWLGRLPDDVLERYEQRHGGIAGVLLKRGLADDDLEAVRRAAEQYYFTRAGGEALDLLATRAFDAGDFVFAADAWLRLAESHPATRNRAASLLARAAAAARLAGDIDTSDALAARLQRDHARDTLTVRGESVAAGAFAEQLGKTSPHIHTAPPAIAENWPQPQGGADGLVVMPDADVPMLPLWAEPDDRRRQRMRELFAIDTQSTGHVELTLEAGLAIVNMSRAGRPPLRFAAPAMVHPLLVEGSVVCRFDDGVTAFDARSGAKRWHLDLPMYRDTDPGIGRRNPLSLLAGDMGRYTLAASGDLLFTVGELRRIDPDTYRKFASDNASDTSALFAVRVTDGKADIAWRSDGHKSLSGLKFLAAPTVADGRLYGLAKDVNSYVAVCLDAKTGRPLWTRRIGPVPTSTGETLSWQATDVLQMMTERASPPAVANDRVYLATNAGLVVCLDARDGSPKWGHRYDSNVIGEATRTYLKPVANYAFLLPFLEAPLMPVNPLVVAGGRVFVLPTDSDQLLALSASRGRALWRTPRDGARHLSPIDRKRLLLSGAALREVDASQGRVLRRFDVQTFDRPAVTRQTVIAGTDDGWVKMTLDDGEVEREQSPTHQPLLGHLLTHQGMVVSVNAAGVSTFGQYELAAPRLRRVATEADNVADRAAAHLALARLAIRAEDWKTLTETLDALEKVSRKLDEPTRAVINRLAFDAALQRAAVATDANRAADLLDQLAGDELTPSLQASLSLARVEMFVRFGRAADAVAEADRLRREHATVMVNPPDNTTPAQAVQHQGGVLGRQWITRLVREHGDMAREPIDDAFAAALKEAGDNVDAVAAACATWPMAGSAPAKLLAVSRDMPPSAQRDRLLALVRIAGDKKQREQADDMRSNAAHVEPPRNPRAVWAIAQQQPALLRTPDGNVVRAGDYVFVHTFKQLRCMDTAFDDADRAVQWAIDLPTDMSIDRPTGGLSIDGSMLVLANNQRLIRVSIADGRARLEQSLGQRGVPGWTHTATMEDRAVFRGGRDDIAGLDIHDGELIWRQHAGHARWGRRTYAQELIAVVYDRGNNVMILDARDGAMLMRLDGRSYITHALSPDGLLVTQVSDGTLSVYDARRNAVITRHRYDAEKQRMHLHAVDRRYALGTWDASGQPFILDMAEPAKHAALSNPGDGWSPRSMHMADGQVAILWTDGDDRTARSLRLDIHNTADGKRTQSVKLTGKGGTLHPAPVVGPAGDLAGNDHWLAFSVAGDSGGLLAGAISAANGETLNLHQAIPLADALRVKHRPSPPTLLNGCALIEADGVVFLLRSAR